VLYGCPEIGVFTCATTTPINDKPSHGTHGGQSAPLLTVTKTAHSVTFSYLSATNNAAVTLRVYDLSGKEVYRYSDFSNSTYCAYTHNRLCSWNLNEQPVSSGIYIAALKITDRISGKHTQVQSRVAINEEF